MFEDNFGVKTISQLRLLMKCYSGFVYTNPTVQGIQSREVEEISQ